MEVRRVVLSQGDLPGYVWSPNSAQIRMSQMQERSESTIR